MGIVAGANLAMFGRSMSAFLRIFLQPIFFGFATVAVLQAISMPSARAQSSLDTDGDGIVDYYDLDDDNDGILDAAESPACFSTASEWYYGNRPTIKVTSGMTMFSATTSNNPQLLVDGANKSTSYDVRFAATTASVNAVGAGRPLFQFNMGSPVKLSKILLGYTSSSTPFAAGTKIVVRGSIDGVSWTNLSGETTYDPTINGTAGIETSSIAPYPATTQYSTHANIFTVTQNAGRYVYYDIFWAGGGSITDVTWANEVYFEVADDYVPSAHPKENCENDTDGDGVPDHQDLDTDGDGCPDAKEAGIPVALSPAPVINLAGASIADGTTTTTLEDAVVSGTFGGNGFIDTLETAPESGVYNGTYDYSIVLNKDISACLDSDGDGVVDPNDLDDDNDGVLDEVECPVPGVEPLLPRFDLNATGTASLTQTINGFPEELWIDIWNIDNNFNLKINDVDITTVSELNFAPMGSTTVYTVSSTDVVLANGVKLYAAGNVWNYGNTRERPLIRVKINNRGETKIYGLDGNTADGNYQELVLVTARFQKVPINLNGPNTIKFGQNNQFTPTFLNAEFNTFNSAGDCDADGDGIGNTLDLDSDNDGCSDSYEANTTTSTAANFQFTSSDNNADFGANGFYNTLETSADSGIYKSLYPYDYAIDENTEACLDTDGDGIPDIYDIDDDNDGVLDAIESPSCFYSLAELARPASVSSELLPYDATTTYALSNSIDGLISTYSLFKNAQRITGKEIFKFTAKGLIAINDLTLNLDFRALSTDGNSTFKLQGSTDDVLWDDLSAAPIASTVATFPATLVLTNNLQPTKAYKYFRLLGVAGTNNLGGVAEAKFTLSAGTSASAHPKPACSSDTDGDGLANHLDLDSDGDGCFDAVEGGAVTATSHASYDPATGIFGGDYGINGLAEVVQTSADSGTLNYEPWGYGFLATTAARNACADTDGDGIPDYRDADADNDGVLNFTEAPSCFFTAAEWNTANKSDVVLVTSPLAGNSTLSNLAALTDGVGGTTGAVQFASGQDTLNKAMLTFTFLNPVRLDALYLGKTSATQVFTGNLTLQGSNDASTWVSLTTPAIVANTASLTTDNGAVVIANANRFTVTSNAAAYRYYRLYSTTANATSTGTLSEVYFDVNANSYITSIFAKPTCATDTDGDGLVNYLDLDSDGDGSGDAYEAGATTNRSPDYAFPTNDVNVYGVPTPVQTNADSDSVNYTSTYGLYATDPGENLTLDTDGDGILDIYDIDDDNDGIPDAVESPECFATAAEAGSILRITSRLTSPDDDQSDGHIQLLSDGNTATLNFNFNSGQQLLGAEIFRLQYPTAVRLANVTLVGATSLGTGGRAKLQGSKDGLTWADLSSAVVALDATANKVFTVGQNADRYLYYRILGTAAATTTANTIAEVTSTIAAGFNPSEHPLPECLACDLPFSPSQGIYADSSRPLYRIDPDNWDSADNYVRLAGGGVPPLGGEPFYAGFDSSDGGTTFDFTFHASRMIRSTGYIDLKMYLFNFKPGTKSWSATSSATLHTINGDITVDTPLTTAMRTDLADRKWVTIIHRFAVSGTTEILGFSVKAEHDTAGSSATFNPAATEAFGVQIDALSNGEDCVGDTDGDGIPNHLDLDSDGDGCTDAYEAGATMDPGVSLIPGPYGTNGLADSLETTADSGTLNYDSTYAYAMNDHIALCDDTDGDGIRDYDDIDDDNDGIPDHIESPGCFYSARDLSTEGAKPGLVRLSSELLARPTADNFAGLVDGDGTTDAVQFVTSPSQNQLNKELFKLEFILRPVRLDAIYISKTSSTQISGGSVMLQGSNDNQTWTNLFTAAANPANAANLTSGGLSLPNSNKFTVATNAAAYRYYRIVGTASVSVLAGVASEVYFDVNPGTYSPWLSPKPGLCLEDANGDGIPNHLDLDSDGDGCSDAFEAGVTTDPSVSVIDGLYGNNGLADAVETSPDSGSVNYASTYAYAYSADLNYCIDSDGDGIPDITDLDDDNDGVLDTEEGACDLFIYPDTTYSTFRIINAESLPANTYNFANNGFEAGGTGLQGTYDRNIMSGFNSINFLSSQNKGNGIRYTLQNVAAMIDGFQLVNDHNHGSGLQDGMESFTLKFYDEDLNLLGNYNAVAANIDRAWQTFPLGRAYYNVKYFDLIINTVYGRSPLQFSEVAVFSSLQSLCMDGDLDTDGDGIPNHLDPDSDGDGCSDAFESGATTDLTVSVIAGPYGENGLADSVETSNESGVVNYVSYYDLLALDGIYAVCTDADGDGIPDYLDIDSDNDGVPDHIESPGCFYSAPELSTEGAKPGLVHISSELLTNAGAGNFSGLVDGAGTTAAVQFATSPAQSQLNKELFKLEFILNPVRLDAIYIRKTSSTQISGGNVMLQGSNDNQTWTNLFTAAANPANAINVTSGGLSLPNSNKFTVAANAAAYRYYRIVGTATANVLGGVASEVYFDVNSATYNPSLFPKPGLCLEDTDGDGISNHLDLDSDGDGISDAVEAGNTTCAQNNTTTARTGVDANGNGLLDIYELGTTGTLNYTPSYSGMVDDPLVDPCTDTDGDGIPDITDLDDDNDGIPDDVERNCASKVSNFGTNGGVKAENTAPPGWVKAVSSPDIADATGGVYANYNIGTAPLPPNGNLSWMNFYSNTQEAFKTTLNNLIPGNVYQLTVYYSRFYAGTVGLGEVTATLGSVVIDKHTPSGGSDWETRVITFTATAASQELQFQNTGPTSALYNNSVSVSENAITPVCEYLDTDNDGIPNHLDPDSDGDGCSDAFEAGVTTDPGSSTVSGPYGANGLADSVETSPDSGMVKYDSTYTLFALSGGMGLCDDSDGDGIPDYWDIDDDNDGVPDAVESPECFATAAEAAQPVRITSALTSPDDDQSDGDIQLLRDGNTATLTFNFNSGQQLLGAEILRMEYPVAVRLANVTLVGATSLGTGGRAKLQGSKGGTTWTDLSSAVVALDATANKVFTVGQNADRYLYYRIVGTASATTTTNTIAEVTSTLAAAFNPSAHPLPECRPCVEPFHPSQGVYTQSNGPLYRIDPADWDSTNNYVRRSGGDRPPLAGEPFYAGYDQVSGATTFDFAFTSPRIMRSTGYLDLVVYHYDFKPGTKSWLTTLTATLRTLNGNITSQLPLTTAIQTDLAAKKWVKITYRFPVSGTAEVLGFAISAEYDTAGTFTTYDPLTTEALGVQVDSLGNGEECLGDADGDGIPNYLDDDSDGDGCSDAYEAAATSNAGSSTVSGPYGANGLADSLETSPDSGTLNYTSTYNAYALENQIVLCDDEDGDGVNDLIDLDDDNDGLTDCEEGFSGPLEFTGAATDIINRAVDPTGYVLFSGTQLKTGGENSAPSGDASGNLAISTAGGAGKRTDYRLTFTKPVDLIVRNQLGPTSGGFVTSNEELIFNANGASITLRDPANELQIWNGSVWASVPANYTATTIQWRLRGAIDPFEILAVGAGSFSFTVTQASSFTWTQINRATFANGVTLNFAASCADIDTDGDGTANRLDLDSDGDGCTDVYEAGLTTEPWPATVAGPYGTNGWADSLETVTAPALTDITYTITTNSISLATAGSTLTTTNTLGGSMSGKIMQGTVELGQWFLSNLRYTRKATGTVNTLTGSTFVSSTSGNPYGVSGVGVDLHTGGSEPDGIMKFSYTVRVAMKPGYRADKILFLGNGVTTTRNYGTVGPTGSGGSIRLSGFQGTGTASDPDDRLLVADNQSFTAGADLQGYRGEFAAAATGWSFSVPSSQAVSYSVDLTGQKSLASEGTAFTVRVVADPYSSAALDDQVGGDCPPEPVPLSITLNSVTTDNTLNAAESGGNVTLTGATTGAQLGDTVTLTINGRTYAGTVAADGTFSIPVSGSDLAAESHVDASITSGGATATAEKPYTLDTTPPAAPTVVSQTTSNTTPTVTGNVTLGVGETLSVTINGTTYTTANGLTVSDNTWSVTLPTTLEGVYPVTATVTDAAGNIASDTTTNELVIDVTAPAAPTVASQSTSDTTPVITGTAVVAPGETLTVTVNGASFVVVPDEFGNWSLDTASATPVGGTLGVFIDGQTYSVTATVTDAGDNSASDVSTNELTINSNLPATPTVVSQKTNDITPTVTGTVVLAENQSLSVTINGTTYTTANGLSVIDNIWSVTLPETAEGTYSVTATVTGQGGVTVSDTTTNELIIDTTAPAAPTVVSQTTSDSTPAVTGTVTLGAGETLSVMINGTTYTTANGLTVTGNTWSVTLPETADGTYEVTATVTDAAGNTTSDGSTTELTIDTVAPATPTVVSQTTSDSTPTVTGHVTLTDGEIFSVTINGTTYTTANGLSVSGNTWSVTLPETADGTYAVTATVTDAAGNATSDVSTTELTIDTAAPAMPTVVSQITNDSTPTVTGTVTLGAGETLAVTINGTTYTTNNGLTITGNTWSVTLPETIDGTYPVTATVTDAAGNSTSDATTDELTIDSEAPKPTILIDPVTPDNVVNIAESGGDVTLTGTTTGTKAGDTVTLTINGKEFTGTVDENLNFSIVVPGADLAADPDATIDAAVSTTDEAGNTGTGTVTKNYGIDLEAPTPQITVNSVTADNVLNAAEAGGEVTITGTTTGTNPGDLVTLTINGKEFTGTVAADGSYSINVPGSDLAADTTIDASVATEDAAGNPATAEATKPYTVDTTPPALTVTSVGEDTGASNSDRITKDNTLTLTGATEPGATVDIYADGVKLGTVTAGPDGSYTFTTAPLADGEYDFTVTATDAAGNTTDPVAVATWTVDTSVTISITNIAGDPVNASNATGIFDAVERGEDEATVATPVVISGTTDAEVGQTVVLTLNGKNYTTTVQAGGTWAVTLSDADALALNHGSTYPINASVQDLAGNSATTTAGLFALEVDIALPDVPTVDNLKTKSTTPVVGGSAEKLNPSDPDDYIPLAPGDTLTITLNGVTVTATITATGTDTPGVGYDAATGKWTLDTGVAADFGLQDGTYDIAIKVSIPVGDGFITKSDISSGELIINSTPPQISIDPISTDDLINAAEKNQSVTLSGTTTAEVGATVTLTGPDGINYTATVLAGLNGAPNYYTVNVPAAVVATFSDGEKTLTASVTNEFGLSAEAQREYLVDTTPPAAPVITMARDDVGSITKDVLDGGVTDDTLPVLVMEADPGVTVKVYSGGVLLGIATEDPQNPGTYTLQLTTALAEGPHAFVAVATDDAGNPSPSSAAFDLTVDTTPPVLTIAVDGVTADNLVNLAESEGKVTLTGTTTGTQEGDIVTLVINGVEYTGPVDANGKFSIEVEGSDLAADPDVTIAASVSSTDEAGNTGTATGTQTYAVDTTPPTLTIEVDAVTPDNVVNIAESEGKVLITGTTTGTQEGDIVTLVINGVSYTGPVDADGKFSIEVEGSDLAADLDTIIGASVSSTDAAGNTGTGTKDKEYGVDLVAPTPKIFVDPVTPDNILNAIEVGETITITGTTTGTKEGDTVTLTINGVEYTGTVAADLSFSIEVPGSELAADPDTTIDGSVSTTDEAGNTGSGTATQAYLVDTTAPPVPTVISQITNDTSPVISGTAVVAPGDTLTVTVNGATYTVVPDAEGFWTLDTETATPVSGTLGTFVDGQSYPVTATVTDAAGNASTDETSNELTIDLTPPTPAITVDDVTADNILNAAEAGATVIITGVTTGAREGDIVTLTINGVEYTGTVDAEGKYSIEVSGADLAADADGIIDALVSATDEAGNLGTAEAAHPYQVDTEPPTPTITVNPVTSDNILNETEAGETIIITGTTTGTKEGDIVTLTINGVEYFGTVAADLSFSIEVSGADLADDPDKTLDASVTTDDEAGNIGTAEAAKKYVVAGNLAVNSPSVNEGSPFVIFNVTGNPGQLLSLTLEEGSATGDDYGPAFQYFDGATWVDYDGDALVALDENGQLLVRVAIVRDEISEGPHDFTLTVTSAGTEPSSGTATIRDDGTGDLFGPDNTNGAPDQPGDNGLPGDLVLDDDRPILIADVEVNEGSPFGVFKVTGAPNQLVTLALSDGAATEDDYGPDLEYFDGLFWQPYTEGVRVPLDENGELPVRVAIVNDEIAEGAHEFTLTASGTGGKPATATATIVDDGSGDYWLEDATEPASASELTAAGIVLDDDRPLVVSSPLVNEASPQVVFSITGVAGQLVSLATADDTATSKDYGEDLQWWDGSIWQDYLPGTLVALGEDGVLLVRAPIINDDDFEVSETFVLIVTNTGGRGFEGTATILDDGSGEYWIGDALVPATEEELATAGIVLDNDGPLTVSEPLVNEGSPFAVFTIEGVAGQLASLALENGSANDLDFGPGLEYFDGAEWLAYTDGALVPILEGGKLLVRTPIISNDDFEGPETFTLIATNRAGFDYRGTATIFDDGTGDYWIGDATDPASAEELAAADITLDDDRGLTVSSIFVNEGSAHAVFVVGSVLDDPADAAGQLVRLSLGGQGDSVTVDEDYGADLQWFDGVQWLDYQPGSYVPLDANGQLLVRMPIRQDEDFENSETIQLVAINTGGSPSDEEEGICTILDDGTGSYWIGDAIDPASPEELAAADIILDDDRVLVVSNLTVHESLGYAVFTVSGEPFQRLALRTKDGSAVATSDFGGLEYFDGSEWVAYVSGLVTLPQSGELRVRVPLVDDGVSEGLETFQLVATNTGGSDFLGTARVPDRVVELFVMEDTTVVTPYTSHFSGFNSYAVVGGTDSANFVATGSQNLAFTSPVGYTLDGDNQYPVVAEATAAGADPDQVLFIVNVMSLKAIQFTPLTELRLDRQSGLYKQTLRVSNLHAHAILGLRFTVGLIEGAVLFNANDTEGGKPAIRYDGLLSKKGAPGNSVDLVIEVLYKPLSSTNLGKGAVLPDPEFKASLIVPPSAAPQLPAEAPPSDAPSVGLVKLANDDCMIEWESLIGERYAVEYTHDLQRWVRVAPVITANALKTQWIDNGLPKTESHPSEVVSRFYRVVLLGDDN